MDSIKKLLDHEVSLRNCEKELCLEKPDPLMVARRYKDEHISLICALYAYGNANLIVKFLSSLDFSLLEESEEKIKKELEHFYYRFQTPFDVSESFILIKRLKEIDSLEQIFLRGYRSEESVIEGIYAILEVVDSLLKRRTHGLDFLFGKIDKRGKSKGVSPFKRWNMFLRWMVREDCLDMGLWKNVSKSHLIIPLDTHTFKISQKLGLLNRKTYDLHSALLLSEKLKEFDRDDPIKYDFALYRIGQEKINLT